MIALLVSEISPSVFSVTRRTRSDVSESVSQSVSVITDLTDVTLVSDVHIEV